MIETPRLTQTEQQQTAVVRVTVPRDQIQEAMDPAIQEVLAAVASQGLAPAGPVFSRHFRIDPEIFDFEVGVPVPGPVAASGRVQPGEVPAARVARTVLHGGYEGLGEAWGQFMAWLEQEGHAAGSGLWESYTVGPETSPNPGDWRTELNVPLA